MTTPEEGSFTRMMDGLVAASRSTRDGVVNTLDAVRRQTAAARDKIGQTVVTAAASAPGGAAAPADSERDDRFDPEDWEPRDSSARPTQAGAARVNGSTPSRRRADDDEDDYPESWLR